MSNEQDRIPIFDTPLCDGEQSPGATLNVEEKLTIARSLARLGVDIIEAGFPRASNGDFEAVQKIADTVGTEDGPTICGLARARKKVPELYRLEFVQVSCGDRAKPTATVTLLTPDGEELSDAAIGTGPVDAVYKAINRVVDIPNELIEYSVKSVTEGIDAMGEVTIRLRHKERTYSGHAANTDIIVASARAYVSALNRLCASMQNQERIHPQGAMV